MIILSIENSLNLAKKIAKKTESEFSKIYLNSFPDDEIYLRVKTDVKDKLVVLVESFYPNPNKALLRILFAGETLKRLKAKKVILVAPYLGFMRQDKMFKSGEAVNAKIFSKYLDETFDKIITIDPHLHRIKDLKEIFKISSKVLTTNDLISSFISKKYKNIFILGPDWESYQWDLEIAKKINSKVAILEKSRHSPSSVDVRLNENVNIKGKNVVIIDDIISTGNTIIKASKKAKQLGANKIFVIGIHGIFNKGLEDLNQVVDEIFTTNTINNRCSKIDVSDLIIAELKKHFPHKRP